MTKVISIVLVVILLTAPVAAQQTTGNQSKGASDRAGAAAVELTFENLLSEDSYKLYGEVRNVGQLLNATGDLIEPMMKLGVAQKELRRLARFLNVNVESLASSRLMFAVWPARKGIPEIFVGVEMPSPMEAEKLETKLTQVFAPTPERSQQVVPSKSQKLPSRQTDGGVSFVITRSNSFVFLTDQPFKSETLRPQGHKLLHEDQKFQIARNQFAADLIFLYFNFALDDKSIPKPARGGAIVTDQKQKVAKDGAPNENNGVDQIPERKSSQLAETQPSKSANSETSTMPPTEPSSPVDSGTEKSSAPSSTGSRDEAQGDVLAQIETLGGFLVSVEPEWPDKFALAISPESDSYVVRAIVSSRDKGKQPIFPFTPQLIVGGDGLPDAAFVLPDDIECFVSADVDITKSFTRILAAIEKANQQRPAQAGKLAGARRQENDYKLSDPFSEFEQAANLKVLDDLLPAFGEEVGIGASLKALASFGLEPETAPFPMALPAPSTNAQATGNNGMEGPLSPVLVIRVKNFEAVQRLMPQALKALGISDADVQTERRRGVDITSVQGNLAYAIVGADLVVSTPETVKHVIDSFFDRHTLSQNSAYNKSTLWHSRKRTVEIYISPALMERYLKGVRDPKVSMVPALREFLLQTSSPPQAISYLQSSSAFGTLHEIHLPKALVIGAIASSISDTKEPPPEMNEEIAILALEEFVRSEETYKSNGGKGCYGTMDKLAAQNLLTRTSFDNHGYRFDMSVGDLEFEVRATPLEYGKSGRRSFFVDQTGVVHGDDHQGGPATNRDKPLP